MSQWFRKQNDYLNITQLLLEQRQPDNLYDNVIHHDDDYDYEDNDESPKALEEEEEAGGSCCHNIRNGLTVLTVNCCHSKLCIS